MLSASIRSWRLSKLAAALAWIVAIGAVGAAANDAAAQCPPHWTPAPRPSISMGATNGDVRAAVAWNVGGKLHLVIGGSFTTVAGLPANHIAMWDGSLWHTLGSGTNDTVGALTVYNGQLIAAGGFTNAGGVTCGRIARYNGSTWQPLGLGIETTGASYVDSLTVDLLGVDLYAGGLFQTADGLQVHNIAHWNGNFWATMGQGLNSTVNGTTMFSGNNAVIAVGAFTASGSTNAQHIAAWNGSSWTAFGPGMPQNLNAVTTYGIASDLIVGGALLGSSPNFINGVARWNSPTQSWAPLGGGLSGGTVLSFATFNNDLIAVGTFTDIVGGPQVGGIARWTGSAWLPLGNIVGTTAQSFTAFRGEAILPTARFVSGQFTYDVKEWDGTTWSSLHPAVSGPVNALLGSGTAVIAGGDFNVLTTSGQFPAQNVLIADQFQLSQFTDLHGFTGPTGPVYAMANYAPNPLIIGSLIVAGDFTSVEGGAASNVASNHLGEWSALGTGLNGPVYAVRQFGTGLYIAGAFNQPAAGIGRLSGSTWAPLGTGLAGGIGLALTVQGGGLVVGGSFTSAGGIPGSVARWNGTAWSAVGNATFNGTVWTLSVLGTDLIAGGQFTQVGGVSALNIARWDGTVWRAMGAGLPGQVRALTIHNGDLYAGGGFSLGSGGRSVAHWNGTTWQPVQTDFNGPVYALASAGGALWAGGAYDLNGGTPTPFLAQSRCNCPADMNNDGAVDVRDYLAYLQLYAAGSPLADMNSNEVVNVQDYLLFLGRYSTGCN
jgi:hypothetical protein